MNVFSTDKKETKHREALLQEILENIELPENAELVNTNTIKNPRKHYHTFIFKHIVKGFEVEGDLCVIQITAQCDSSVDLIWHDDIPSELPEIPEKPCPTADPILADPENVVYSWAKKPRKYQPCWRIRGAPATRIVDMFTGECLGISAPHPGKAFAYSGSDGDDAADDWWKVFRENAAMHFATWGLATTSVCRKDGYVRADIQANFEDPDTRCSYIIAHGNASGFFIRGGYEGVGQSDITTWLSSRDKIRFAFIAHCDGMYHTWEGTLSYAYRKGSMVDTVTVGYVGVVESDYWHLAVPWQRKFFDYVTYSYGSMTFKDAFDAACAYYPDVDFVGFCGDENYDLLALLSATLYEHLNTGEDSYTSMRGSRQKAQTFTPSTPHKITSVKLYLHRAGTPGTLTVSIQGVDGSGHPDGGDLCSGTTNANTLPAGYPYEWREITLGAGANLSAGTKYAIVVRALDGDTSNTVEWWYAYLDPTYDDGNCEDSSDGGSTWIADTTSDFMFEEWGEGYPSPPAAPTDVQASDGTSTSWVIVTWTKSTGATGYQVYRDGIPLGWLLDVATFADTGASRGSITPGNSVASDGEYSDKVRLSLSGTSVNHGAIHSYKVRARNIAGESGDSNIDTGYAGVSELLYQWMRSAGDSAANWSYITGATTAIYDDTDAPADGSGRYYVCYLHGYGFGAAHSIADRGYRILETIKSSSDSGTGAEAKTLTATLSKSDVGSGLGGVTNRALLLTEVGAGVDAGGLIYALFNTDIGIGADTSIIKATALTSSDVGAGVGAKIAITFALLGSDVGVGVETYKRWHTGEVARLIAILTKLDSGTGAEASEATSSPFHSSSDLGAGAEHYKRTIIGEIAKVVVVCTGADTGIGVDALLNRLITLAESGSGVDVGALSLYLSRADAGEGIDSSTLSAILAKAEAGTGIDRAFLRAILSKAETGEGSEVSSLIYNLLRADVGVGLDAIFDFCAIWADKFSSDSGLGIDSSLEILIAKLRALRVTALTSQYRKIATQTSQHRKLKMIPSQYRKIKSITSEG